MKQKLHSVVFLLLSALLSVFVTSCGGNEETETVAREIAANGKVDVLLNSLYISSDGDLEAIARILQVTPSVVERLRTGKTTPRSDRPEFERRLRDVSEHLYKLGNDFSKLRSEYDPEWSWYNSVFAFLRNGKTLIVFLVLIIGFTIGYAIMNAKEEDDGDGILALPVISGLFYILLFVIFWVISLCCSPNKMEDKYVENPNFEIEELCER